MGEQKDLDAIQQDVFDLLDDLGIDMDNENFKDTPLRVAKFFTEFVYTSEFLQGHIQKHFSRKFTTKNDEIVLVSGKFFSLCPHHVLPVSYNYWVGYIPNGWALGISKFQRVIGEMGKYPQLQEDLTPRIVEEIEKHLNPKGVGVILRGEHMCMRMRGVREDGVVTTSHLSGTFIKPEVRAEFLNLIDIHKRR